MRREMNGDPEAYTREQEGTTIFGNGPQWTQATGVFEISINAGFEP